MSITTLTLNGNDYISYASVEEANTLLATDPVRNTIWAALTNDQKIINLISATRRVDMYEFKGRKTLGDANQNNKWPRADVLYPDGTPLSDNVVPYDVELATILLAGTIASDVEASQNTTSSSNIKKVEAGSTSVEYFRAVEGLPSQDETAYNFLIPWLATSSATHTENKSFGFAFYNDPEKYEWL